MIEGSLQQENITIINIYELNIKTPNYMKQILINLKGEIDNNTIIVFLNTSISIMDRTS